MNLNHLHLMVKNITLSKVFYENLFGFKEKIWYGDDLLFLQNSNGFDLALSPTENPMPLPKGFHYGFTVTKKTQLEDIYHLGMQHYPQCFKAPPQDYGNWGTLVCTDLDGYSFEIYWDENLHTSN